MKLKPIFIIFNILVLISFLFVFLLPAFFLGWEYAGTFWRANWYLALIFVVVLAALNAYFLSNWKLFRALEDEEWSAVIEVMEERVLGRGRFSTNNIRVLVNAYVVTNQAAQIRNVEERLREGAHPALARNAMLLGVPHILSGDGADIVAFFDPFRATAPPRDQDWISWSYGFGLMLSRDVEKARGVLGQLVRKTDGSKATALVRAMSAYILDSDADNASRDIVSEARLAIRRDVSPAAWTRLVDDSRSELHILILSKLLRDVREWIYGADSGSTRED